MATGHGPRGWCGRAAEEDILLLGCEWFLGNPRIALPGGFLRFLYRSSRYQHELPGVDESSASSSRWYFRAFLKFKEIAKNDRSTKIASSTSIYLFSDGYASANPIMKITGPGTKITSRDQNHMPL